MFWVDPCGAFSGCDGPAGYAWGSRLPALHSDFLGGRSGLPTFAYPPYKSREKDGAEKSRFLLNGKAGGVASGVAAGWRIKSGIYAAWML